MTFDATSDVFTSETRARSTRTTHTTTATDPQGGSWAVVAPSATRSRPTGRAVDVERISLLLDGVRADPKWAGFVAEQVTVGLPTLEELVGTPWP